MIELGQPRYAVGIDLGTTNCVLAVIDLQEKGRFPKIQTVPLLQRTDEAAVEEVSSFPSFLYWPTEAQAAELPSFAFDADGWVMGHAAAKMGSRVKGRLVSSAKSWLCHSRVDRTSDLLPWGGEEGVNKISPLKATTLILKHLKFSWEQSSWGEYPLEEQVLTVTLPASFDQSARGLTVQACEDAGLSNARLLEEPQAAFYNWISLRQGRWSDALAGQELVLICDVGGGTSDFSLIRCAEVEGQMTFERQAVGDHLLLGGDNIDLSLAHMAESRLSGASKKLNLSQWQLLSQLSRRAKEDLLSGREEQLDLRLPGSGRKVIGGLRKATLTRSEVIDMVMGGFFPDKVKALDLLEGDGLHDMGLPYESDPAITKHVLAFIENHGQGVFPGAVLFNGGSLEPQMVRERICEVLKEAGAGREVVVLESDSLADAVARGAAYYGFSSQKGGLKVGGGLAQAYYIGVEAADGLQHLCVMPKGSEAHEPVRVDFEGLEVETNRPVSFELVQSDAHPLDEVGAIQRFSDVAVSGRLNTMVRFGKQMGKRIPVELSAELTELDTLQMELVSVHTDHRWKLEFDLRAKMSEVDPEGASTAAAEVIQEDVQSIEIPEDFDAWVESCFVEVQPKSPLKLLEKQFGVEKSKWDMRVLRRLADVLLANGEWVDKSSAYEAMWLMSFSFAFRPGFGDPEDEMRRQKLWGMYRNGARSSRDVRANSEWAIMWRRIAAGLEDGRQSDLFQRNKKRLLDKKGQVHFKAEGAEFWRMLCSMEAMPVKDKVKFGQLLLSSAEKGDPLLSTKLWCLSRLGTRLPLGGRLDAMPTGEQVSLWIDTLMEHPDWMTSGGSLALVELGRRCGERLMDVSDAKRAQLIDFLDEHSSLLEDDWRLPLEKVVQRDVLAQSQMVGESLPLGLKLQA